MSIHQPITLPETEERARLRAELAYQRALITYQQFCIEERQEIISGALDRCQKIRRLLRE